MNRQFGNGATTVYAGLSALDYRVAAGSIGPQGTIPHAPVNAHPSPVFNVPTTGLPSQGVGNSQAPALQARSGAHAGPTGVYTPYPTFGPRPTGGPVQGPGDSRRPVAAPRAVGAPLKPNNWITHPST